MTEGETVVDSDLCNGDNSDYITGSQLHRTRQEGRRNTRHLREQIGRQRDIAPEKIRYAA